MGALQAYPGGLQVGGGITAENAEEFLTAGASHVIVTSYVFCDGKIQMDRLKKLRNAVGKEHLVLDLSCRKKDGKYYIVPRRSRGRPPGFGQNNRGTATPAAADAH